jgi:hypothetical protein
MSDLNGSSNGSSVSSNVDQSTKSSKEINFMTGSNLESAPQSLKEISTMNGSNVDSTYIIGSDETKVNTNPHSNFSMPKSASGRGIEKSHWEEWTVKSGVSPEITQLNVRSVKANEAKTFLNIDWNCELADGWLVEGVNPLTGEKAGFGQYKPMKPMKRNKGKAAKYVTPAKVKSEAIFLGMPDADYWKRVAGDISVPLHITEGAKKAGCGLSIGSATVALVGVWNGQEVGGADVTDTLKAFAIKGRKVYIEFDADLMIKEGVRAALIKLAKLLIDRGCIVYVVTWDGSKGKGLDDYVVNCGSDAFQERVEDSMPFDQWLAEDVDNIGVCSQTFGRLFTTVGNVHAPNLYLDVHDGKYILNGKPLEMLPFRAKMGEMLGEAITKQDLADVVHHYASKNPVSDVLTYLESCHQKYPNASGYIDKLGRDVLGVSKFEAVMLMKWMVGAVARQYQPGCQMDNALVLIGEQGIGKTSLLRILAGEKRLISTVGDPSNKDFLMKLQKCWMCELGEISSTFRKSDNDALKMFITETNDVYRRPYGDTTDRYPRRFVIAGTTNDEEFLKDVTGNRRYFPISVPKAIDLRWVAENRDRLWAEIVGLYKDGMPWWLVDEEVEQQKQIVKKYQYRSGFYEALVEAINSGLKEEKFTTAQILTRLFQTSPGSSNYKKAEMEIANDLKLLGFEKDKNPTHGSAGRARYWQYVGISSADTSHGS